MQPVSSDPIATDDLLLSAGPLSTRTNEGLSLKLYVTFQYKIIQADIPKIYLLTGTNYETTYLRIARETLLAIAGSYNAQAYWVSPLFLATECVIDEHHSLGKQNCDWH